MDYNIFIYNNIKTTYNLEQREESIAYRCLNSLVRAMHFQESKLRLISSQSRDLISEGSLFKFQI